MTKSHVTHRSAKSPTQCRAGFTLVELMVVVAVIGILVAIAIPVYVSNTEAARIATDQANVRILNSSTMHYRINENISTDVDVFAGREEDQQRMQLLVDNKYIANIPEPQYQNTSFQWVIELQYWKSGIYKLADKPVNNYLFSEMLKGDFIYTNYSGGNGKGPTWSITENGLETTGANQHDLLFIDNNNSEYTVVTKFQLGENSNNNGGLGIFFETSLNPDSANRDSGYILQFDRTLSEVVIRRRTNGRETPQTGVTYNDGEEPGIIARIGNQNTSTTKTDIIPHKSDSNWWEKEHEISLEVKEGNSGKKLVTVSLNNNIILTDFDITSNVEPVNNFTGFRGWNNAPVNIIEMSIE